MGERACYFGLTFDFFPFFLENVGLTGECQVVSPPHRHCASAHVSVSTQWFTQAVRQGLKCTRLYFKGSPKAAHVWGNCDISWVMKLSQLGQ